MTFSRLLSFALLALPAPLAVVAGQPGLSQVAPSAVSPAQEHDEVIRSYCLRCHRKAISSGGLNLESFDVARAAEKAEVAEKMIRKLQAGMMPASPARRPDRATVESLVAALASGLDQTPARPSPAGRTFQRLTRVEYERAIYDLLQLEVDAGVFLPADTVSAGFDNIADAQGLSATVMEGYLSAAGEISRLAVGDPEASPSEAKYTVPRYASQWDRADGAPYGTRGGLSVEHIFPADGLYTLTLAFYDAPIAFLFGYTTYQDEQIEISIDGERVALLDVDRWMDADNENLQTGPIFVRAGPQRLSAAFLRRAEGPVADLLSPHAWSLADRTIGAAYGVTTLPHLRDLVISGPQQTTGVSATRSRERIFSCRPTQPSEELGCARQIVSRLAAEAYRRPLSEKDLDSLIAFYEEGAALGGFEAGVGASLEAILAAPHFVFRFERLAGDRSATSAQLSDLSLASRLSYFLWSAAPDEELLGLARAGRLSDPAVLQEQVDRMLADLRSEALATRFAAQWLRLQDLDKIHPDSLLFPDFYDQLAQSMRRETELLFDHLVREDRSLLELLTADYTFVDERLARHYGMSDVAGDHFRRVPLPTEERRGLLGHASILTLTSHADRTSAVLRGKWVMAALLGSPPPPPPPNVPELDEVEEAREGRLLTVRERMEEHRSNPACSSCHKVIDPLGLALESFDVTGRWRSKDNGAPVDTSGELYDGRELHGPADLRQALLDYQAAFVTTFSENLLAYGIGRRIEPADMPQVRAIGRQAAREGHRISAFISGVVMSEAFRSNNRAYRGRQVAEETAER